MLLQLPPRAEEELQLILKDRPNIGRLRGSRDVLCLELKLPQQVAVRDVDAPLSRVPQTRVRIVEFLKCTGAAASVGMALQR